MSSFTMLVIMSFLMIAGGFSLLATPLSTFLSTGYFIIILFFAAGVTGIIRCVVEKRYGRELLFAIVSLGLGAAGLLIPGVADMNNSILLYMAASWLVLRGILSIAAGIGLRKRAGAGSMLLGILLGILEIGMGAYSFAHPAVLAVSLGILIGLFYIETGVNSIIIGSFTCEGGNGVTVLLTFMGLLMIVCGISMLETPLFTFLKTGYWIIALFFIHGVLGVIRSIGMKRFGWDFLFALLSLGLGIAGIMIPDVAAMNNAILLYMAAAWFVLHGILAILASFRVRKQGGGIGLMLLGILLGIVEIALGGYCAAHPAVLALSLGLLIGIFFVESGVHMIIIGSSFSRAVAIREARLLAAVPAAEAAEAEAAEAQAVEAAMAAEAAEEQAVEAAEAQAAAEAMAAESEETAPSGEETQR